MIPVAVPCQPSNTWAALRTRSMVRAFRLHLRYVPRTLPNCLPGSQEVSSQIAQESDGVDHLGEAGFDTLDA